MVEKRGRVASRGKLPTLASSSEGEGGRKPASTGGPSCSAEHEGAHTWDRWEPVSEDCGLW